MVICLECGAHLHIAQLMPLPLTVSCFSRIQIGFTFLVPAHPGSPGQRAIKWGCVCCGLLQSKMARFRLFTGAATESKVTASAALHLACTHHCSTTSCRMVSVVQGRVDRCLTTPAAFTDNRRRMDLLEHRRRRRLVCLISLSSCAASC